MYFHLSSIFLTKNLYPCNISPNLHYVHVSYWKTSIKHTDSTKCQFFNKIQNTKYLGFKAKLYVAITYKESEEQFSAGEKKNHSEQASEYFDLKKKDNIHNILFLVFPECLTFFQQKVSQKSNYYTDTS